MSPVVRKAVERQGLALQDRWWAAEGKLKRGRNELSTPSLQAPLSPKVPHWVVATSLTGTLLRTFPGSG